MPMTTGSPRKIVAPARISRRPPPSPRRRLRDAVTEINCHDRSERADKHLAFDA